MKHLDRTLSALLFWLAIYVGAMLAMCVLSGKPHEAIPILTHLISGFSGAAFAMARYATKGGEKASRTDSADTAPERSAENQRK